ncbi:MAG: bifunctional riboflavin kinase/FAD synthetase [Bacteroidota bacterium]|nr:bifunctional riboflavin kinase/FAD synthetase [Bacteroidota bacterium]
MTVYNNLENFSVEKPVVSVGTFDGVHIGHRHILQRTLSWAKEVGGEAVVVTLWPHPRIVLNPEVQNLKLLNTPEEKEMLLQQLGIKHLVVLPFTAEFASLTSCQFIRQYLLGAMNAHYLVYGFDHRFGCDREGDPAKIKGCVSDSQLEVEKLEGLLMNHKKISSTHIRQVLLDGDIANANKMLGYQYFLSGKVIEGRRIGRSIGFPTANIEVKENYKLVPTDGVYAVKVKIDDKWLNGMLNIGQNPTVSHSHAGRSIEVNIFDYADTLYNQQVSLQFIARLRNEIKFDSIDLLRQQLEKDKVECLKILRMHH